MRSEVDTEAGKAIFFYSYKSKIFQITMVKKDIEGVYYYILDDSTELSGINTLTQEVEATIGASSIDCTMYVAQLQYGDGTYIFNGVVSLEEMKKIVENIYFL